MSRLPGIGPLLVFVTVGWNPYTSWRNKLFFVLAEVKTGGKTESRGWATSRPLPNHGHTDVFSRVPLEKKFTLVHNCIVWALSCFPLAFVV